MALQPYVHVETFEEYKERFKDFAAFKREDGIIEVRLHWKGDPAVWSYQSQHAYGELWTAVGHDKENEVMILTCQDPYWMCFKHDNESFAEVENGPKEIQFNCNISDTMNFVENFINDIEIPTISAINGPGLHYEFALMSDIAVCDENFVFTDSHFRRLVPGDGMAFAVRVCAGIKRGNYFMFMMPRIDAKKALEWGLVDEVLPHERLMERAWEIARQIMQSPRTTRRLTHEIAIRPWKRALQNDERVHVLAEMYNVQLEKFEHDFDTVQKKIEKE